MNGSVNFLTSSVNTGNDASVIPITFSLFSSSLRIAAMTLDVAPPRECPVQMIRPLHSLIYFLLSEMIHLAASRAPA
ncbi:hypothetical protein TRFO_33094 [Tritrichomonas foetus]|uniref:Uncharacterized protein n=1 Tax=Tritrichomonas foetus TaxID=1144522 RepID=A0A1J4JPE5_9EUKA|nr:hypothetical protein TRFO_33094 [Tritrichomonas foetus]|eukprot:OHT00264.1 hypothetical protein TRFO_33094 [Tritrichomonas foetus]